MSRGPIAATNRFACTEEFFVKIFVSSTEFCRSNMLQKIKSDRICVTCYDDNIRILLQRQRFSQKFSSTYKVICPCNMSPRRDPQLQIIYFVVARPAHTE